jgi:hypothetical protein
LVTAMFARMHASCCTRRAPPLLCGPEFVCANLLHLSLKCHPIQSPSDAVSISSPTDTAGRQDSGATGSVAHIRLRWRTMLRHYKEDLRRGS